MYICCQYTSRASSRPASAKELWPSEAANTHAQRAPQPALTGQSCTIVDPAVAASSCGAAACDFCIAITGAANALFDACEVSCAQPAGLSLVECIYILRPFRPLPDAELLPCVLSECLSFFSACLVLWGVCFVASRSGVTHILRLCTRFAWLVSVF